MVARDQRERHEEEAGHPREYRVDSAAMRAWILGVVICVVAACGKDSGKRAGPAVVPGAAAGEVLEVTGDVTATRGGDTRALAVGDDVSGDDVITTAAGASVVVGLLHNGVKWSLKGGFSKRLADAAAWSAPGTPVDPSASLGERTTAADRVAAPAAVEMVAPAAPPPPRELRVEANGPVTQAEIEAVLAANRTALVACAVADGGLASFIVKPDGTVRLQAWSDCARPLLEHLVFPQWPVETEVRLSAP